MPYVAKSRHGANTIRHSASDSFEKTIPFSFTIKLPPPHYERLITARNPKGENSVCSGLVNKTREYYTLLFFDSRKNYLQFLVSRSPSHPYSFNQLQINQAGQCLFYRSQRN